MHISQKYRYVLSEKVRTVRKPPTFFIKKRLSWALVLFLATLCEVSEGMDLGGHVGRKNPKKRPIKRDRRRERVKDRLREGNQGTTEYNGDIDIDGPKWIRGVYKCIGLYDLKTHVIGDLSGVYYEFALGRKVYVRKENNSCEDPKQNTVKPDTVLVFRIVKDDHSDRDIEPGTRSGEWVLYKQKDLIPRRKIPVPGTPLYRHDMTEQKKLIPLYKSSSRETTKYDTISWLGKGLVNGCVQLELDENKVNEHCELGTEFQTTVSISPC